MKIPPRLLRKIELYCILNNIDDYTRDTIPHECSSCVNGRGHIRCIKHQNEIFKFHSNGNYKELKPEWPEGTSSPCHIFYGCLNWVKK